MATLEACKYKSKCEEQSRDIESLRARLSKPESDFSSHLALIKTQLANKEDQFNTVQAEVIIFKPSCILIYSFGYYTDACS